MAYKWGILTTYESWDDPPSMCWGPNSSRCFRIVGMVINLIVGVYIPIIRIPVSKGGIVFHPQYNGVDRPDRTYEQRP